MVKAGLQAIYLSGWQVAADANLVGHTYPDQSLYPANSGPALARRINGALLRADQIAHAEGDDVDALAGADRGRRRGRLRRPAERVRDHEGVHRGRRRGGPLRGSALLREEVRASRRQGADPDLAVPAHARRRAAGSRCGRRPVADRGAHRRALGDAAHERHRRGRPRVLHRRANPEGFYRVQDGIEPAIARGLAYAPYADLVWFETSTPDLDEAEQFAARDARAVPRQVARLQLLAVVQLAATPRPTRRSPASSAPRRRWATASSSSPWPASTRSTCRCSSSRAATATRRCPPTSPAGARVRARGRRATRRPGTSARSAPATSTGSWRRSPAGCPPRSH